MPTAIGSIKQWRAIQKALNIPEEVKIKDYRVVEESQSASTIELTILPSEQQMRIYREACNEQ